MDMDDFPDDLQLDDEPFEPFDDYEAFADEMMEQAQRSDFHEQQAQAQAQRSTPVAHSTSTSSSSSASRIAALPPQQNYLAMLDAQTQQVDREVEQSRVQSQQRRVTGGGGTGTFSGAAKNGTAKGGARKSGSGWNRPIGSNAGAAGGAGTGALAEGDLAAVNIGKKRAKQVRLDSEKLLGNQGFPMLMDQGKRLKIRDKYRTSAEKDLNSKKNLADLMMLYQTWAHNLFPKSTFRDFIIQAESKCKSDKQIKATMNGWRDAYWDEEKEKQRTIEEVKRAAQEADDQMNSVWEEHAAARSGQGSTENMDQDPFLATEKNGGQPSSLSNWSFGQGDPTVATTGGSSSSQPRPRPAATASSSSRKGKGRMTDNPSAAMRLQISDDEDEVGGQDDYELALTRMRDSMNLNSQSPVAKRTSSSSFSRQRRSGGVEAMNEDPQEKQSSTQLSGGARASSIFDEEEDDDEAPLFTHRALQMIGGLSALEERQRAAAGEKDNNIDVSNGSNIPGKTVTRATLSSDDEEDDDDIQFNGALDQVDPSPVNLSLRSEWGASSGSSLFEDFKDGGKGVATATAVQDQSNVNLDFGGRDDEDDDEAVVTQRRPKARKAIILEDSDDE
ncbi:chromosome segregation in meiosis- protein [Linnemannia zychae]|nr:chromosome segregation in meiosis- protein [Linnemannia zychae]